MHRLMIAALLIATAAGTANAAPLSPAMEEEARNCAGVLDTIPHIVRKETVAAIGPGTRVVLHQVCRGLPLYTFGNAAGLTRTIANNPVLAEALAGWGWRPDDVVGVEPMNGRVDLYVHRD